MPSRSRKLGGKGSEGWRHLGVDQRADPKVCPYLGEESHRRRNVVTRVRTAGTRSEEEGAAGDGPHSRDDPLDGFGQRLGHRGRDGRHRRDRRVLHGVENDPLLVPELGLLLPRIETCWRTGVVIPVVGEGQQEVGRLFRGEVSRTRDSAGNESLMLRGNGCPANALPLATPGHRIGSP